MDDVNLRRLERAVEHIDVAKLFEVLRRPNLPGIVSENARDVIGRTSNRKLQEILSYLA